MELLKDFTTSSAYTFFSNSKKVSNLLERGVCDEDMINEELNKKYPSDKYFFLVDYIDDRNNGYFHIRVWKR